MISNRIAGMIGIAGFVIFWAALFVLGSMRESYSQLVNDVSELGAIGTPNAAAWNVVGFIIPGVCLAVAGWKLAQTVNQSSTLSGRIAGWLISLFGLGVAGQGVFPALMAGGVPVLDSWHTRTHLIVSIVSGIAWVVGTLLLIGPMRRNPRWSRWYIVNIAAVLLAVALSFGRGSGLPDGALQKIGDLIVFGWFLLMSFKLMRSVDVH